MKNKYKLLFLLLCLFVTISCSDDESELSITLGATASVKIAYDSNSQTTYTFECNREWSASCSDDWLTVSPSSGKSGSNTITLTASSGNATGADRSTTVTITLSSGSVSETITVTQEPYIYLEATKYDVEATGGTVQINLSTSMTESIMCGFATSTDWITISSSTQSSLTNYCLVLTVSANNTAYTRSAKVYFVKGSDRTILAAVTILQLSSTSGVTTDKSADGMVSVLQTASKGNGIPIVLMGDGFIDTEIADGTYDTVMSQAVTNIFSEEPMSSLQDYFTIYSIVAVSDNNVFGSGFSTAFSCELEGNGSTGISGDDEAVYAYLEKIDGLDTWNVLVVILLNSLEYAGTTYIYYTVSDDGSTRTGTEFAISYCPTIYGVDSESFRQVLVHEAVGHGLAKLNDEYAYESYGTITSDAIAEIEERQGWGWFQNVSVTSDSSSVPWAQFISDTNFASEEIGVYEGACTYYKGAYRPTYNSVMRDNTGGFNAPSRKEIYYKVMERGLGFTPTYDEFVSFDMSINSNSTRASRSAGSATPSGVKPAAPRIVERKR